MHSIGESTQYVVRNLPKRNVLVKKQVQGLTMLCLTCDVLQTSLTLNIVNYFKYALALCRLLNIAHGCIIKLVI